MSDVGNERVGNGSLGAQECEVEGPESQQLLIAIIVLGVISLILILMIIYGYLKYVRGKINPEGRNFRDENSNIREILPESNLRRLEPLPEEQEIPTVSLPVKTRKRSMTFSETDEECRKYREALSDTCRTPNKSLNEQDGDRSRKKSVVTFVGVK